MKNFEKYIEFIKNNKLLVLVIVIAGLLMLSILFTRISMKLDNVTDNSIKIEYQLITKTKSFEYYIYQDKYYVNISDPNKTNKDSIRATLGIPSGIDFEIIYPNVLDPNRNFYGELNPSDIPPEGNCCD